MRGVGLESAGKNGEQTDEGEQRRGVRVRLAVVVTEQALVVSDQAGIHVGRDELIVVREPLGSGELERAVVTTSRTETTDVRVIAGQVFSRDEITGTAAARVEQEVVVTIVKRTVLDDLVLRTVDTTEA